METVSMNEKENLDFDNGVVSSLDEGNSSYLITVVIPIFNGEKYFRECLDSIVNQTLGIENIEVIIVDDFSSDNSVDIAKEYVSKYPSIKLIQNPSNLGLGPTRNIGLKHASSDFVSFLDCDDYFSLNAFEKALKIFDEDKDVDLVIYKWEEFKGKELLNVNDVSKVLLREEKVVTDINDCPGLIFATYATIKVYSKRLFEFLEFPSITYEDNVVSARVMINSNKMYVADDITMFYRRHGNQITSIYSSKKYLDMLDASKQVIDLREDYPDYYDTLSFLALKLVYNAMWYLTISYAFTLEEGEKIYPKMKEFPKYFSHDIFEKYQRLFPNYLLCDEQCLWDIEKMDFYEFIFKNRYQKDIKRINGENFNLKKQVNSLKKDNANLKKNISDLKKKNSKLNKKVKSKNKKIKEIKNTKSWKLTAPLRKLKRFFSSKK